MQSYLTRARSIQDPVTTLVCSDYELAEKIVGGASVLFRESAAKDDIIEKSTGPRTGGWSFSQFEKKALDTARFLQVFDTLHGRPIGRQPNSTARVSQVTSATNTGASYTPRAPVDPQARSERWAAFMRSTGRCPRCKTQCAKWLGGCDAPANMAYIPYPADFPQRPPYPAPNPNGGTASNQPPSNQSSGSS